MKKYTHISINMRKKQVEFY